MRRIDADALLYDLEIVPLTGDGGVDINDLEDIIKRQPTIEPERTGRWIETEGLDVKIRCTMCTNPMRSDRGCDGSCQYDEKLYKQIMSIIEDRIDGGET